MDNYGNAAYYGRRNNTPAEKAGVLSYNKKSKGKDTTRPTFLDLVSYAHTIGMTATKALPREEQKALGQFMTPPSIAAAMATRTCAGIDLRCVRILEPAAGGGILAAAVLQELLAKETRPQKIDIVLCEFDERLHNGLKRLADKMRQVGREAGVQVSVRIFIGDFLMSELSNEHPKFDVVIANPPYFKLNKSDPRAVRHAYAVYGQPNIYGLFMAACARVLAPSGRWCFIMPRSWTNGPYFAAVRRQMLRYLHIDAMHVFESRQDHFTDDEILQEAMITWATAQSNTAGTIIVSTSQGVRDLSEATLRALPSCEIISPDNENVISLPTHDNVGVMRDFTSTLATYGIKVSTGPVVAFRAEKHIVEAKRKNTVPLLWMQHVNHMRVSWPIQKKREHILANADSAWMLVPNENMVIMRRFSPKEDQRRITAAPYIANSLPGDVIGLENHTNYLYRPGGALTAEEVYGLCAYLNSRIVDQYLRHVSGNTQINAADLRVLPLPTIDQLTTIGRALSNNCTLDQADRAVEAALGIQPLPMAA